MRRFIFVFIFLFFTLLIFGVLLAPTAQAFPETFRHGYVHCSSCHASLAGGDILTAYGRSLSRELISQTTLGGKLVAEGDEEVLGGVLKTPKWLTVGGGIRVLQTFVESKTSSRARFMIMQVDFDFLAQATDRLRTFFSIGRVEPKEDQSRGTDFIGFPRYGVDYSFGTLESNQQTHLRVGRFMPAYGIPFAEHPFVTRSWLNFQPGQERIAAELSWANDQTAVLATAIGQRAVFDDLVDEVGGVVQANTAFGEKIKIGANYYSTEMKKSGLTTKNQIYGLFANMGFSKNWYGLFEIDRPRNAFGKWGLVEIFKLGYEMHQGLHWLGVQEFANGDSSKTDPKFEAYSLGLEWFPRPHLDFLAMVRRERHSAASSDFQSAVWLIGHYYF